MKSKIALLFVLFHLLSIPLSFGQQTERSYKAGDFCTETAKAQIKDLNSLTDIKVKEIETLKGEINNLTARSKLIGGYLKLKDAYLKSIDDFTNAKKEADSANPDQAKAAAFRELINTAMAMSLVNNIVEAKKNDQVKTIQQLCTENQKINSSNFCITLNTYPVESEESASLEKIFQDVSTDMKHIPTAETNEINGILKNIYNKIPKELSPDKIIADLVAPSLDANADEKTKAITEDERRLITSCFGKKSSKNKRDTLTNNCKSILTNQDKVESFKKIFFGELEAAQKTIMEAKLASLTSPTLDNDKIKNAKTAISTATQAQLNFLKDDKNKLSDLGVTSNSLKEFSDACASSEAAQQEQCKTKAANFNTLIETQNADVEKKLHDKIDQLNRIVNPTGELYRLEQMKQYVQTKYLRTCSDAKIDSNEYSTNICSKLVGISAKTKDAVDAVESLNNNLAEIVNALQPHAIKSNQGELGAFAKSELDIFKNDCENKSIQNKTIDEICADINSESNRIANQKESKEWDEFHKKYWVKRNESNSKGYDVYEKKSTGRIIGDGIAKITGRIAPIIIGNMNLNYQIDMMANQAIYMKQINYMNDPNSSWMMNNSYFQGNYFNQAAPFSGFDAATSPTTTPAASGFNFSN